MAPELLALVEAGRALAVEDRFELAHQMLISADDETSDQPVGMDASWAAEFRRRINDIDSGAVQLVDGADTMRMARERIAHRRAASAS